MKIRRNIGYEAISAERVPDYYAYRLEISRKYLRVMTIVISLLNLLFLWPDLTVIRDSSTRTTILFLRGFMILVLLVLFFNTRRLRTFKAYSLAVAACELMSLLVFNHVFCQYENPDFLIQTMGVIVTIIVIFYIPGLWSYRVFVSFAAFISFFLSWYLNFGFVNPMEFSASAVYLIITIVLCSFTSWNNEAYQFKEYQARVNLEYLSSTDYLTTAVNRLKMQEEADRLIRLSKEEGFPLSLVFIDVDYIKRINDQYGHLVGDSVLANLVKIIRQYTRKNDILARWGGDEFVLLLPNIQQKNAVALSERIRKSIERSELIKGLSVTCSFGVVDLKDSSQLLDTLISKADKLMYEGKKTGRNVVRWDESGAI